MTNALQLQSFDSKSLSTSIDDVGPSEEYYGGFQDGVLATEKKLLAQQHMLREDVAQALSDTNFTFAEAQSHIINQLEPLFKIAISTLFPSFANHGFLMTLQKRLLDAARTDICKSITLSVHPNQISALEALIMTLPASNIILKSDTSLTTLCAFISIDSTETVFDLDTALSELQETIAFAISA